MINTSGYQVNVMPHLAAIDPSMYAVDPTRIMQGAHQGLQFLGQMDQMRAFRAEQAEKEATRQSRIANTKALSDLAVLHTREEQAISDQRTAATLAHLNLATETDKGSLLRLPQEQDLGDLERSFKTQDVKLKTGNLLPDDLLLQKERGFKEKKLALDDKTMATDKTRSELAIDAKTDLDRAQAEWHRAEAQKEAALAKATAAGKPPKDEAGKKFDEAIGSLSALLGKPVEQLQALYASGAMGTRTDKSGKKVSIPVASELAALAENLKKPEFYLNPYEDISPEARAWMGHDVVSAIANKSGIVSPGNIDLASRPVVDNKDGTVSTLKSISVGTPQGEVLIPTISPDGKQLTEQQAIEQYRKTGQHLGIYTNPEAATQAAKELSNAQGERVNAKKEEKTPAKVKVDSKGNIERPEGDTKKQDGVTLGDVGVGAGLAALTVASSPTATKALAGVGSKIAQVGSRLWEGRSAAGQFTGNALKSAIPRGVRTLGSMGVRAASLPVAAAFEANNIIGKSLSDKDTGDMSALSGIAMSNRVGDFNSDKDNAKYDELSHRITSVIRSTRLSEDQKNSELAKLLNEREILWSAMNPDHKEPDLNQDFSPRMFR